MLRHAMHVSLTPSLRVWPCASPLPVPGTRSHFSCRGHLREEDTTGSLVACLSKATAGAQRCTPMGSRQGKITALAIAFIVTAKIREQLQEALLLPGTCNA